MKPVAQLVVLHLHPLNDLFFFFNPSVSYFIFIFTFVNESQRHTNLFHLHFIIKPIYKVVWAFIIIVSGKQVIII